MDSTISRQKFDIGRQRHCSLHRRRRRAPAIDSTRGHAHWSAGGGATGIPIRRLKPPPAAPSCDASPVSGIACGNNAPIMTFLTRQSHRLNSPGTCLELVSKRRTPPAGGVTRPATRPAVYRGAGRKAQFDGRRGCFYGKRLSHPPCRMPGPNGRSRNGMPAVERPDAGGWILMTDC